MILYGKLEHVVCHSQGENNCNTSSCCLMTLYLQVRAITACGMYESRFYYVV